MFLGHFGLGFGAKRAAPAVSLGTFFMAAQFADLLWPTLLLLGIERVEIQPGATTVTPLNFVSYPYSHSLLALAVWGLLFGGIYAVIRRSRLPVAITLALLVISHWVLDYVTHRPDMPLTLNGPQRVGLGFAATFSHGFGEIRKEHREPEPERDAQNKSRRRFALSTQGLKEQNRCEDASHKHGEHDRVANLDPRAELLERIHNRSIDQLLVKERFRLGLGKYTLRGGHDGRTPT